MGAVGVHGKLLRNGWLCGAYSDGCREDTQVLCKGIQLGEMDLVRALPGLLSFIKPHGLDWVAAKRGMNRLLVTSPEAGLDGSLVG